MLPLAQHRPPGFKHPLVEPWAAAQVTPTAIRHLVAARASFDRPRTWQLTPPDLRVGSMLLPSGTARRKAKSAAQAARVARQRARALEKEIAEETDNDTAEALSAELDKARAAGRITPHVSRKRRRAVWAAERKGRSAEAWRGVWAVHAAKGLGV